MNVRTGTTTAVAALAAVALLTGCGQAAEASSSNSKPAVLEAMIRVSTQLCQADWTGAARSLTGPGAATAATLMVQRGTDVQRAGCAYVDDMRGVPEKVRESAVAISASSAVVTAKDGSTTVLRYVGGSWRVYQAAPAAPAAKESGA